MRAKTLEKDPSCLCKNRLMPAVLPEGLIRLGRSDIPAAADLLAEAFQQDEFNRHLIPVASERYKAFRIIYRVMLGIMLATGEMYATSDAMEGVAVLTLAGKKGDRREPDGTSGPQRFFRLSSGILNALAMPFRIARFRHAGKLLKRSKEVRWSYSRLQDSYKRYEQDKPYVSLDLIAVRPGLHGRGYMGRLMRPVLDEACRRNRSVILNTETPGNLPIYEHYGFQTDESIEVFRDELVYRVMSWHPKGSI